MTAIALAFVALIYLTGACLVVLAVKDKRVWREDENGGLDLEQTSL